MSGLLACPFCREMFTKGEAERCPACDVALTAMEALPPSVEVMAEAAAAGELLPAEDRPFSLFHAGRGRGALLGLALLGLAFFFAPWVEMWKPNELSISGFDLARGRAGWLWGGAVGWFITIPLVASRRTVRQMRGVRIITAMFAAMTAIEIGMLLSLPPQGHKYVPLSYEWGWGLWASGVVALVGVVVAFRLGGRIDDLPALPYEDGQGNLRVDRNDGEMLH